MGVLDLLLPLKGGRHLVAPPVGARIVVCLKNGQKRIIPHIHTYLPLQCISGGSCQNRRYKRQSPMVFCLLLWAFCVQNQARASQFVLTIESESKYYLWYECLQFLNYLSTFCLDAKLIFLSHFKRFSKWQPLSNKKNKVLGCISS
jgi:hypothetical protein